MKFFFLLVLITSLIAFSYAQTNNTDSIDITCVTELAKFTFNPSKFPWSQQIRPYLTNVVFQNPGYSSIGQRVDLQWLGFDVFFKGLFTYTQIPYGTNIEQNTVYELISMLHDKYWPTYSTTALRLSDCSGYDIAPKNRDLVENIQGKYSGNHDNQADENGWTFYGLVSGDDTTLEHAYALPPNKSALDQVALWQSLNYPEWQHMEGWFLIPDGQGGYLEVHGWTGWWFMETNKTLSEVINDVDSCIKPSNDFLENVSFDPTFLCFSGTGDLIGCNATFHPVNLGGSKRSEINTWNGHYGHPRLRHHLANPHQHYNMADKNIANGITYLKKVNNL